MPFASSVPGSKSVEIIPQLTGEREFFGFGGMIVEVKQIAVNVTFISKFLLDGKSLLRRTCSFTRIHSSANCNKSYPRSLTSILCATERPSSKTAQLIFL